MRNGQVAVEPLSFVCLNFNCAPPNLLHLICLQLADIKNRHGPELNFMQLEFDRLERELVPGERTRQGVKGTLPLLALKIVVRTPLCAP